jgi:hypothetical protein
MDSEKNNNGWTQWRQHVLLEIQRIDGNLEKLETKTNDYILSFSVELSRLKILAIVYGGISGTVAAVILREVIHRW